MKRGLFAIIICLVIAAAGWWGFERYRFRVVRSDADLLHLLPAREATLFYVNVASLRQAGDLQFLAGAQRSEEAEYMSFVRATGFDYTRDLDTVTGSIEDGALRLAARGHFDWRKLQHYAQTHPSAATIQIRRIQPDVLAIAGDSEADEIRANANQVTFPNSAPVWIEPAKALLLNPARIPMPFRIFAISLQSANRVVLSLEPARGDAVFRIVLDAAFRNEVEASTARDQFARSTLLLKNEVTREHHQPSPRDLDWLLVSGTFGATGSHLKAAWPVRRELMNTLK